MESLCERSPLTAEGGFIKCNSSFIHTLSELSNEISRTREAHVSESASFKHTVLSKNRTHLLQAPFQLM